ncbi:MAG: HEAT repeat domain-containing protein [Gemmataceae bacterium]|nr:HEAT repeat domain-containing protein [Gemmataceae bacterium]
MFHRIILSLALAAAIVSTSSADERQYKAAMERAIGYLKQRFGGSNPAGNFAPGSEDSGGHGEGPAALAGIAMLEAGVRLDDPVIQHIARQVREAAIHQNKTYQLALDIIFLDKLGEEIDTLLIQSMAVRLLFGQTQWGGWSYYCAGLDDAEKQRLRNALNGAVLKGGRDLPTAGSQPRATLDEGIAEMLKGRRMILPGELQNMDDNSNTQFAVIALWTARKYGIPVDNALKAIETRFRATQNPNDGGWSYTSRGLQISTPSMTCAGLLGLAIVYGAKGERTLKSRGRISADGRFEGAQAKESSRLDISKIMSDKSVKGGLAYIGNLFNATNRANQAAGGGQRPGVAPNQPGRPGFPGGGNIPLGPAPGPAGVGGGPPGGFPGAPGMAPNMPGMQGMMNQGDPRNDLYFLWSLERVCMVYGLKTLPGGKDWYTWGADYLVQTQQPDGSWYYKYGNDCGAAFGVMFLCRSNIVRDLSAVIDRGMKSGQAGDIKPSQGGKPSFIAVGNEESKPLTENLVSAGDSKRAALLKEFAKGEGEKFTLALADAIPQLKGDAQEQARKALTERMTRENVNKLRSFMDNDSAELRRAAAVATGIKKEKELTMDLIRLLDDIDTSVWRAAAAALRDVTGKDFGPKSNASDLQRTKAIQDWLNWYEKNKGGR